MAEAKNDAADSKLWIQGAVAERGYYASSQDYMYSLAQVHAKLRGYYYEDVKP
jgi:hypothetical protein